RTIRGTDAGVLLCLGAEACGRVAAELRARASGLSDLGALVPGRRVESVELDGQCRVAHGDRDRTGERRSWRGSGETRHRVGMRVPVGAHAGRHWSRTASTW